MTEITRERATGGIAEGLVSRETADAEEPAPTFLRQAFRAPDRDELPPDSTEISPEDQAEIDDWLPEGFVREPFGTQQLKLNAAPRPGFHRHWFNDVPGRIERATKAGYKHVNRDGQPIKRVVGRDVDGSGLYGYLMEIPEQYFRRDMARGQKPANEIERAIMAGTIASQEGDNRFVRKDGIQIEEE